MSDNGGKNEDSRDEFELYRMQTGTDKLKKLGAQNPFLIGGVGLGLAGLFYMVRNYKNKSESMKTSVYLIHTRMVAQMSVIGVLSIGMIHQIYSKLQERKP